MMDDPEAIQIGEPEKEIVFEPVPMTEPAPQEQPAVPTPQEPEKVPAGANKNLYGWSDPYEDDPYAAGLFAQ